ncbi:MAG: DUF927 domain-containing protein [Neisseriales bacterium]|nr:MAG: DUF927 domain-containing protein [Neisseriales bacterium]
MQNYNCKQSLNQQIADFKITNAEHIDAVNDDGNQENIPIIDLGKFRLYQHGLYAWIKSKNEQDNGQFERIGNYILPVGKTNLDGISCLLLEFTDSNSNKIDFMLERGELADYRGLIKRLLNAGYVMDLYYSRQLQTYLNEYQPESNIIATRQTGWINNNYVMPDRIIGDNNSIRYYGAIANDRFISNGTVQEWREQVAKNCEGYDILELSLYAGFSSLLMPYVDFGFGLHIHGKSSGGKTTALRVASSIFGNPKTYISKWNSTHNGMEFYGYNSNHSLCALDEVNEAAKTTLDSIYMLIDGRGKTRAISRVGGVEQAKPKTWQTVALSTGEVSIEDLALQYSKNLKAGESVRMIDIEVSYICKDKAHSDLLIENTAKYHGTANIALIEYIQVNKPDISTMYKNAYSRLINQYKELHSQASRVAKYFALMCVAGDLAITAGIIPNTFKPSYYTDNQFKTWYKCHQHDKEFMQVIDALITAVDDGDNYFARNDEMTKNKPNLIGIFDGFEYYLISSLAARKLYKKTSFNTERKILQDAGILSSNRINKRIMFMSNKPTHVYQIIITKLDNYRGDDE